MASQGVILKNETIPTLRSRTSVLVLFKHRRKSREKPSTPLNTNGTEVSCKKPTPLDSGSVVGSGHADCDAKQPNLPFRQSTHRIDPYCLRVSRERMPGPSVCIKHQREIHALGCCSVFTVTTGSFHLKLEINTGTSHIP